MGTRERTLLLCMAYPEISQQYGATVCMAGVTESGELRRIYPVPFDTFREKNFEKRRWIEYEIAEKGDYRKESYKIDPDSVEIGEQESYTAVRKRVADRTATFTELNTRQEADNTSLGFVTPRDVSLTLDQEEERARYAARFNEQTTLTGGSLDIEVLPHHLRYHFRCGEECSTKHDIMCEDIEIGQLYRRLKRKYTDLETIEEKLQERFVDWMVENRDLYFMVGTHFQHGTWLIISVLYPKRQQNNRITDFV
jgi:hypothetical protein